QAANLLPDAASADLALRVLAKVLGENSELRALWEEVDDSRWHRTIDDLRRRLAEPALPSLAVSPQARQPGEGPVRIGDVIQLLTSTGKAAYVQLVGQAGRDGFDLIRIMPGPSRQPLDDANLAALAAGDTAFFSQGLF